MARFFLYGIDHRTATRGICGLQWQDFDAKNGALEVKRTLILEDGKLTIGQPKTDNSIRKIIMPASTVTVLATRKKSASGEWIFPNFQHPDQPLRPSSKNPTCPPSASMICDTTDTPKKPSVSDG